MYNKLTTEELQAIIASQIDAKKSVQDIVKYLNENYQGRYNSFEAVDLILMCKDNQTRKYPAASHAKSNSTLYEGFRNSVK